jgi:hypothetical protein
MNTHSHSFSLKRVFAAIFACCALLAIPGVAQAADPANIVITSTAPSGAKYGTPLSYTVTYTKATDQTVLVAADASSSAVCKVTSEVVSILGAGTCKINVTSPAGGTFDAGTATQSFSISKAALSITASSSSNFFGGVVPGIVAFYSGFVNGDTSSKVTTKPTCSTTAISVSNPGTYPTICEKAVSANYSFTYTSGTYVISKAPLVLIPSAKVHLGKLPKKYNFSGFGWQGWDDEASNDVTGKPSCKVPSKAKRKPGIYKITCTVGKAKSLNYALSFATGILVVKK